MGLSHRFIVQKQMGSLVMGHGTLKLAPLFYDANNIDVWSGGLARNDRSLKTVQGKDTFCVP